ncbi:hypothetical protein BC827DRAFT_1154413 [Russula dissimulans]|nr:hypothetical protein BC827DRAFT_1154413 [Russula dissimulans]
MTRVPARSYDGDRVAYWSACGSRSEALLIAPRRYVDRMKISVLGARSHAWFWYLRLKSDFEPKVPEPCIKASLRDPQALQYAALLGGAGPITCGLIEDEEATSNTKRILKYYSRETKGDATKSKSKQTHVNGPRLSMYENMYESDFEPKVPEPSKLRFAIHKRSNTRQIVLAKGSPLRPTLISACVAASGSLTVT